jgi:flagellar basal body-associated protein FliL
LIINLLVYLLHFDNDIVEMAAIPEKHSENKKPTSGKKSTLMVIGIIGAIALVGVSYMLIFVAPNTIEEPVKIIAVTENGCIAETLDGFAVNIGTCNAKPGDLIMALIDQKVKERAMAMNPT